LIVTAGALRGLARCRRFLGAKNRRAARRAAEAIKRQFATLEAHPEMGRPHIDTPDLRELLIPFGESGYIALYRFDPIDDAVVVLAFRHLREAGY
jgi:plasmid stabilization system protein ParE